MRTAAPTPGDYVVEYRHLARWSGVGRVAVLHLTHDAGPEELFTSNAARSGERAESLVTLWAFEDRTCAWRVTRNTLLGDVAEPIGVDSRPATVESLEQ